MSGWEGNWNRRTQTNRKAENSTMALSKTCGAIQDVFTKQRADMRVCKATDLSLDVAVFGTLLVVMNHILILARVNGDAKRAVRNETKPLDICDFARHKRQGTKACKRRSGATRDNAQRGKQHPEVCFEKHAANSTAHSHSQTTVSPLQELSVLIGRQ